MVNYAISDQSTSGKVYIQNQAALSFTDDGTTYTARIQMAPMDLGTNNRKFWNEVELIHDIEASSSPITLSYNDHDYDPTKYVTRENQDLSEDRVRWTRVGSSRRRAWVITHSANTPMRIELLQGRAEIGTS